LDNGGFETLLLLAPPPPLNADDESNSVPESVIDNYEIAEKKYTASYLYAIHKCRTEAKRNLDSVDKKLYTERFNAAFTEFDSLDAQRHFGRGNSECICFDSQQSKTKSLTPFGRIQRGRGKGSRLTSTIGVLIQQSIAG
jgi:hypothetical protein